MSPHHTRMTPEQSGNRRSMAFRMLTVVVLALTWHWAPTFVYGHAAIDERIAALTEQIEERPDDPYLYLKRGELYRVHEDWASAMADYRHAERLVPDLPDIHFYKGRMWLEAGHPEEARPSLDRFISVQPNHANALLTRARVLSQLGDYLASAADYKHVIAQVDRPTPELYIEYAHALVSAGPEHVDRGVQTLDAGIARLGPLITLIQYAVEIESRHGRYEKALARIERLPPALKRQPVWLKRRGDVLYAAGREKEARTVYTRALTAIDNLPPRRRGVKAMVALKTDLRSWLDPDLKNASYHRR